MGAKKDVLIQTINLGLRDNKARLIIEELKKNNPQGISQYIRDAVVFYYENIGNNDFKKFEIEKLIEKRKLINKKQRELAQEAYNISDKLKNYGYLD